jgi:hypothetical protein
MDAIDERAEILEKEKLARTIEITRCEDTKLSSNPYKQLVERFDGVFEPEPESGSESEPDFKSESDSLSERESESE